MYNRPITTKFKLTTGQTLAGETIENIHGLAPLIHINSD